MDLIRELSFSVENFHKRFNLVGPITQEELLTRIPIQAEEVTELHQAILHETPERIANEAADVAYVAIGTLLRLEGNLATSALIEVIQKNNAKTSDTHHVNQSGKVVRR